MLYASFFRYKIHPVGTSGELCVCVSRLKCLHLLSFVVSDLHLAFVVLKFSLFVSSLGNVLLRAMV